MPISHTTVEKLISMLEDCYKEQCHYPEMWSDFNLVSITYDLMDGDYHRDGAFINVTDETMRWLEVMSTDSPDDDMQLIAKSLQLNFSITVLD